MGVGFESGFNSASCLKSPKTPRHPFFLLVLKIFKDFPEVGQAGAGGRERGRSLKEPTSYSSCDLWRV